MDGCGARRGVGGMELLFVGQVINALVFLKCQYDVILDFHFFIFSYTIYIGLS